MKVKYIGPYRDPLGLINNNVYECLGVEHGWYRVIDETGEDYLYPSEMFEIVDDES